MCKTGKMRTFIVKYLINVSYYYWTHCILPVNENGYPKLKVTCFLRYHCSKQGLEFSQSVSRSLGCCLSCLPGWAQGQDQPNEADGPGMGPTGFPWDTCFGIGPSYTGLFEGLGFEKTYSPQSPHCHLKKKFRQHCMSWSWASGFKNNSSSNHYLLSINYVPVAVLSDGVTVVNINSCPVELTF